MSQPFDRPMLEGNVFCRNGIHNSAYCSSPHPKHREGEDSHATVFCRRPPGHDGEHSAYVFHITAPEFWPA